MNLERDPDPATSAESTKKTFSGSHRNDATQGSAQDRVSPPLRALSSKLSTRERLLSTFCSNSAYVTLLVPLPLSHCPFLSLTLQLSSRVDQKLAEVLSLCSALCALCCALSLLCSLFSALVTTS